MRLKSSKKLNYKSYNHIFIMIFIGVAISFFVFITAFENYNKDLKADFSDFAKFQTELFIKAIDSLIAKMKLIEQLYYGSGGLNENEYNELFSTISKETTFEAFLVFKPTPNNDFDTEFFAGRINPDSINSNIPFLKKQLNPKKNLDVSQSFTITNFDSNFVAINLLMKGREKYKNNILTGLINLDLLFKTRASWVNNSKLVRAFIYETDNIQVPFYKLDLLPNENLNLINKNDDFSLIKLRTNSAVYYEQTVRIGEKSWIILLIPNHQYLLASYAIFPWILLVTGLTIVSLLGYYSYKLTKTINKLETRSSALLESKRFVQNIINYAVDGLITINSKGIIESYNPTCEKMFGYKIDEIINQNIAILIPTFTKTVLRKYLNDLIKNKNSNYTGVRKELKGLRKDGTTFPLDMSFSKVETNDRKIFNGIIRDITDRKEGEEIKEKLIHQLTENNIELEQFAYIASHDLQEPLRTITNYTSLITTVYKDNLDKDLSNYLSICMNAAKRMHELVSGLLEYASLGQNTSRFHSVNCNEILKSVTSNLWLGIKERKAKIMHGKLPNAWGSPVLLVSLFQNLINNGLKYQPDGQIPIIKITTADKGNHWLFSISDNGLGIEKKYLEKIFIPFKRLHSKHEFPGSGIGLAVCKRIISKCKGEIWVESKVGKGSTFYFTLLKGKGKDDLTS